MSDKKISDLPLASSININDVSVLVNNGADYKFAFSTLLQLIGSSLNVGVNISFGIALPQNSTGNNGDVFVNTNTGSFAQKISGTWTIVYTLPSATGTTDGTVLYGIGTPGSIGNNNDTYINTGTGVFYKKTSGTWNQVFSMQTGPAGTAGSNGLNGINGNDGFSILNGSDNPSNLNTGVNGDFYINITNYTLFGPKAAGDWGAGVALIGNGLEIGGADGQVLAKASDNDFDTKWVDLDALYAKLTGNYTNPSWITSLAWSKLTNKPTTIAGYGITDFNTLGDTRYLQLTGGVLTGDVQQTISPINGNSIITKAYADNLFTGLSWKQEVKAATTSNITLSGTQTIDGVALTVNDRVLVKNQTTQTGNGIYLVQSGAWTRTTDADTSAEIGSATVLVRNGSVNKNTQWTCTNSTDPAINTDNITFGQISGAGTYTNGNGIALTSNVFSLDLNYTDVRYALQTTTVAGFALSGNVALANLSATNSTLTFSGTYNGSTARTLGLNLGNANNWTGVQIFSGNSTPIKFSTYGQFYTLASPVGGIPAGLLLASIGNNDLNLGVSEDIGSTTNSINILSYAIIAGTRIRGLSYSNTATGYANLYLQQDYGNVLVGTSTPTSGAEKLQVSGSVNISNNLLVGTSSTGATTSPNKIILNNQYSNNYTDASLKLYLFDGGAANTRYGFGVGQGNDLQYHSATYHDYYVSNAKVFSLSSTGANLSGSINGGYYGSTASGSYYIGSSSILPNAVSYQNLVVGPGGGGLITTGISNVIIGTNSVGNGLSTGSLNTIIGGFGTGSSITTGTRNVAIGGIALYQVTSGGNNVAVGTYAGYIATGSANIFLGDEAHSAFTSGNYNIFIGAGNSGNGQSGLTSGSGNVIIGSYWANLLPTTLTNTVIIGNGNNTPLLTMTPTLATFATNVTAPNLATIVASADLHAQTAVGNVISAYTVPTDGLYQVMGRVNLTAVTTNTVRVDITFTDENSVTKTISCGILSTAGTTTSWMQSAASQPFYAKAGTTISVVTINPTSGGSNTFDMSARIIRL